MSSLIGIETNCERTVREQARTYSASLLEDDAVILREFEHYDSTALAPWRNAPQWAVLQQRVASPDLPSIWRTSSRPDAAIDRIAAKRATAFSRKRPVS